MGTVGHVAPCCSQLSLSPTNKLKCDSRQVSEYIVHISTYAETWLISTTSLCGLARCNLADVADSVTPAISGAASLSAQLASIWLMDSPSRRTYPEGLVKCTRCLICNAAKGSQQASCPRLLHAAGRVTKEQRRAFGKMRVPAAIRGLESLQDQCRARVVGSAVYTSSHHHPIFQEWGITGSLTNPKEDKSRDSGRRHAFEYPASAGNQGCLLACQSRLDIMD